MKYISVILMTLLVHEKSIAQQFSVTYELNFKGTSNHSVLQVLPDRSYFIINQESGNAHEGSNMSENVDGIHFSGDIKDRIGSVYLNKYSDSFLYSRELELTSVHYIFERKNDLEWTLLDSTKDISNYVCNLAKTHFRGRTYWAWFTREIPVPSGPWKLIGLPGLILYVADETNDVIFTASKIQQGNRNQTNFDPAQHQLTPFVEYFQNRNNRLKEIQKRISSKAEKGFKVSVQSINVSYIETDL